MRLNLRSAIAGIAASVTVAFAAIAFQGAALAALPSAAPVAAAGSVSWSDCGGGFQCGTLSVPKDYSDASKGTIELALIRLPAKNQSQRIGSLLVNPGGPGASAIDFTRLWARLLSNDIRNRFDVTAFDPRGVGYSTPIECHDTLQQLVAVNPDPETPQEWQEANDAAKTFVAGCQQKYADLLPYVGTKNVARDMESVRKALGEEKLTYLGYSYGTAIGATYADMYPDRVRAFVLDGAVDLSLDFKETNRQQMVGFERAYQAFVADCKARNCALAKNGDPGAAVDALLARVDRQPLPARGADRPAGPGETLLGIASALYSKQAWPQLTNALLMAINNGDGSQLVNLADEYLQRNSDGSYPNLMEANMAVNYADEECPKDPKVYEQLAADWAKSAPHFGASAATAALTCAYWPGKPDPVPAPRAKGAPPIVVISTTNDPATPYEWGVALSKQLESGRLLIHRGEGHTIYAQGDSCVDQAVNAYLLNLQVPDSGKTCGTGAPPPESSGSATAAPPSTTTKGATATATGTPGAAASPTQKAPGAPNTGSGKDSNTRVVAAVALIFVVAAAAVAGALLGWQRTRN